MGLLFDEVAEVVSSAVDAVDDRRECVANGVLDRRIKAGAGEDQHGPEEVEFLVGGGARAALLDAGLECGEEGIDCGMRVDENQMRVP